MEDLKGQCLGYVTGPDGNSYSLDFYGGRENAAVITGPLPVGAGRTVEIPEVHREPATDAADARLKLAAWLRSNRWV
jgi:hypothetical protein